MLTVTPSDHGGDQFKPNTTLAWVVVFRDKFLLVEEIDQGNTVFNQPAGHLEADENLIDGAKRELIEETGLNFSPDYASGIYYFHRPELSLYFLRFCFVLDLSEQFEQAPICIPNDEEIISCQWLTLSEIQSRKNQLRSPMVLQCIEDYLNNLKSGEKIPLSQLKSNL